MFSRKRSKAAKNTKVTTYVRDIVCLPEVTSKCDKIVIPRGEKRSILAENGLVGKLQFHSDMPEEEVRKEICSIFAKPMGLKRNAEKIFQFSYLQSTGAGSRSLCTPSVSESFRWDGQQVASLSKSGGYIYIKALEDMPGCCLVCKFLYLIVLDYHPS